MVILFKAFLFTLSINLPVQPEQVNKVEDVKFYQLFELAVTNTTDYADPFRDVELIMDIPG